VDGHSFKHCVFVKDCVVKTSKGRELPYVEIKCPQCERTQVGGEIQQ
jgi:hypothetical protein